MHVRALLGPPSRFFEDSENTAARNVTGFSSTLPPFFRNIWENFDPRSCKVRSSGQVKWPNYKITFQPRHGYNVLAKVMKLSEYDKVISAYKTYISNFVYGWLRSGHFCDLPIIRQWAKNQRPYSYLAQAFLSGMESHRIGQLLTIQVKICIAYPSKGHLRSPEVTNCHLPITFQPKELETWDWCQYVRLGQVNRLICNMTHFGHHETLVWPDLRSNFELDFSRSFYIWLDVPNETNTMV